MMKSRADVLWFQTNGQQALSWHLKLDQKLLADCLGDGYTLDLYKYPYHDIVY